MQSNNSKQSNTSYERKLRSDYKRGLLLSELFKKKDGLAPMRKHLSEIGIDISTKAQSKTVAAKIQHLNDGQLDALIKIYSLENTVKNETADQIKIELSTMNTTLKQNDLQQFDIPDNISSISNKAKSLEESKVQIPEESKTNKGESHHDIAVQIINSVLQDPAIYKKVPYLITLDKLEKTGKIDRQSANMERADAITNSMKSNKQTKAFVERAIHEHVKSHGDSQRFQDLKVSQLENLGQRGYTDVDVDVFNQRGRSEQLTQRIKSNDEFDRQIIGDNGLGNQTGSLNTLPNSQRVGPKFGSDAKVKDNTVENLVAKLVKIKNNPNSNADVKSKAKLMIEKLHKVDQNAAQASAELQHSDISANYQSARVIQSNDTNNIDFAKGDSNIPRGMDDLIQTAAWKQLVNDQLAKGALNADQKMYAESILYDPANLIDNLDMVSSKSASSFSTMAGIMQQIKNNNGNYGQLAALKLVDKDGKNIDLSAVLNMIPKVVDTVSKIQGSIDLTKKLNDYKKQTEVFSTVVQKQESNKFAVQSGSAFRLRSCC